MTTHWHILGAGAIGCHWAAALIQAGYEVTLIVRNKERLAQLQDNGGITLTDNDNSLHLPIAAEMVDAPTRIQNLLVTTKAYDCLPAVTGLQHRLQDNSRILLLQNGMGSQQQVVQAFPGLETWAGSSTDGAWLKAPFQVVMAGRGTTLIGPLTSVHSTELFDPPPAGVALRFDSEIELSLWRKLAINCAINPLTALNQCQNGQLEQRTELRNQLEQVCAEIDRLLEALQLELFNGPLFPHALAVARQTGENFSSMLQDVRQQRLTEIDYITGYLLQRAEEAGLELPANRSLYHRVLTLQQSYLTQPIT